MKKKSVFLLALMLTGAMFAADFTKEFQKARTLLARRQYAQACKLFEQLASTVKAPAVKDQCYSLAAEALAGSGKYDQADQQMAKIKGKERKTLTAMKILKRQKKFSLIGTRFGKEDFSKYPDSLAWEAFALRGEAFLKSRATRNQGISDCFNAAQRISGNDMLKAKILNVVMESSYWGKDAVNLRKSTEMILAGKPFPTWGVWLTAQMYLAELELKEGSYEKALQRAGKVQTTRDVYAAWKYQVRGDAYEKMGKKAQAAAEWKKGAAIKSRFQKGLQARLKKAGF